MLFLHIQRRSRLGTEGPIESPGEAKTYNSSMKSHSNSYGLPVTRGLGYCSVQHGT